MLIKYRSLIAKPFAKVSLFAATACVVKGANGLVCQGCRSQTRNSKEKKDSIWSPKFQEGTQTKLNVIVMVLLYLKKDKSTTVKKANIYSVKSAILTANLVLTIRK